jgi:hypothetical protein
LTVMVHDVTITSMKHPDSKKHLYISLAKSGIRIAAGVAFFTGTVLVGGTLIIAAELLGIWEELV